MLWQLVLAASVLGAIYYRWSRRRLHRLAAEITTSLKCYPIVGHAYKFFGTSQDRMNTLQELGRITNQQDGMSSAWLGNELVICITDPNAIEVISKTCMEKPEHLKFSRTLIGNGSIFAPANIWHPRRKINAPFFSMKNLNNLVSVFDRKSTTMVELMRREVGAGDFPIWKYATTFTFDTVCETATGTMMDSQDNPDHPILHAIDKLCHMLSKRILFPWQHPNVVYENLPVYKEFRSEKKIMCEFVDKIVKERGSELKRLPQNKDDNNNRRSTFLDMIIRSSAAHGKSYSDMELREEILVMIIAGNDTSAVGTSFTAVLLSRYPEVQEKVYQELREVFGDSERAVTPEDLPRLKYLEAVIKESLRLYPPIPIVSRLIQSDLKLESGTTLVEGTAVCIHIWGMHRNPAYWGADAEQFRPERFLQPLPHPAMFIPFSYSVRSCIGGPYAMFSVKTALANLVRRYRLLPPAGARAADLTAPLPVKYDIMMKAVDNFVVRVEERNKTI